MDESDSAGRVIGYTRVRDVRDAGEGQGLPRNGYLIRNDVWPKGSALEKR